MAEPLVIAMSGDTELALLPALANRHGCVTGATGTGKTVTMQKMAESFSGIGVPVFMADIKGDFTGIAAAGKLSDKMKARLTEHSLPEPKWQACPVTLWDIWGEQGHPVRATVSDMGPLLFARLLNLNETQEGVLSLVFKVADDNGLLLLDLKDLRAIMQYVGDNAAQFKTQYGNVSSASIGAIQRGLLQLEEQGGDRFFGEPMLDIADLMQTADGKGVVNILVADKMMNNPRLYASFLLWLLAELFENLPEVGDRDKPKLVFFFDEAHLLFNDAPAALLEKVEQVVRLIRSKGVGVFFVTQNPLDIPDKVLGQLGNRVQHALRAFTPRDQKAVKSVAETMRANPKIDATQGDFGARGRRGAGELPRREGHTRHHGARVGAGARFADRSDHPEPARAADQEFDRRRRVREDRRSRLRVRDAEGAGGKRGATGDGRSRQAGRGRTGARRRRHHGRSRRHPVRLDRAPRRPT